jgi:choline dehydrogenase
MQFSAGALAIVSAIFSSRVAAELNVDGLPTDMDWIVVGGGAGGCCAAAALADLGEKVMVLERGASDLVKDESLSGHTWPAVVNQAAQLIRWTDGTWGAVGNVLGGGSSVNDGYFFEEDPEFLKNMFGPDSLVTDDFYKSSAFLADTLLTPLPHVEYGDVYGAALVDSGLPKIDDTETRIRYKEGAWRIQSLFNLSEPKWTRHGPARLIRDRNSLPNLLVFTNVLVRKISFVGNVARGVEVGGGPDGKNYFIAANKGVILSAGVIFTPQILQISGVGDAKLLEKLGVPQVVPSLPVGQNFIDRLVLNVGMVSPKEIPLFLGYGVATDGKNNITLESVAGGRIASELAKTSLGLTKAKDRSELFRPILEAVMATPIADIIDQMAMLVGLMHNTHSRGSVIAASQDSSEPPIVTANYFQDPRDLKQQVANLRYLIKIAKSPSMAPYRQTKISNNHSGIQVPEFLSCLFDTAAESVGFVSLPCIPEESKWEQFVQDTILSSYHYFGTAAAGTVVEGPNFAVKGTDGLYIADASVIPSPTRINPVGSIMSIGHYVGSRLAKAKVPAKAPVRVRQICITNKGLYAMSFSLSASSGGVASWDKAYSAGFTRCVDASEAKAQLGDTLSCKAHAVLGADGDCTGGSFQYDATSALQAMYTCNGAMWAPRCNFMGLSPMAVQPVRQVCVRNIAGFAMYFSLVNVATGKSASSKTYSAGFTGCIDGNELQAKQGDKLAGSGHADAGDDFDLTGADLSYDATSTLQAVYKCTGSTLEFTCEFQTFSSVTSQPADHFDVIV